MTLALLAAVCGAPAPLRYIQVRLADCELVDGPTSRKGHRAEGRTDSDSRRRPGCPAGAATLPSRGAATTVALG